MLIEYKIIKETVSNGIEFEVTVTEKGQEALNAGKKDPKLVCIKLAKTIIIFVSLGTLFLLITELFGLPEGIITISCAYIAFRAIEKIWHREQKDQ